MLRKPAFGFHPAFPWVREVRAFPFCSRPAPVCTVLAGVALTFWQNVIWGTCCCPPIFWRLRDRRRLEACGATGTGKGVSEAHLSFLPGIAEIYGCLYWISTEPRKLGARWFAMLCFNEEILRHKEVVTQDFVGWAVAPVYLLKCNVCPMRSFLVRMYFSSYGVTGTSMGTFSTISSP